jgi:hypothetical protein
VGATSADTQREIEEIRKDVTSAVGELRRRASRATDVKTQSTQLSGQAREHPAALAGAGLVVAGIGGALGVRAVLEARRRRRPEERLKRTMRSAAEELSERWERARDVLPLDFRLRDGDDDEGKSVQLERNDPSMIKKALWAALVATMVAAGGLLARRLSAAVWRAAMQEDPPTASV